jgi:excinuclease UvrABC nuclease subunit
MDFINYPQKIELKCIGDSTIDWSKILNIKCKSTASGIYAFVYDTEIIYIGKTNSVRQRVKRHYVNKRYFEFANFLHNYYKYIEIILLDDCSSCSTEMKYINYYKPKFNRFYYEV